MHGPSVYSPVYARTGAPCHPLDPRSHQRPRAFALLALLVVAGGLSGCEAHASFGSEPAKAPPVAARVLHPEADGWSINPVVVTLDSVNGVACYGSGNGFSCVKVRP